jgi:hypothetical protein
MFRKFSVGLFLILVIVCFPLYGQDNIDVDNLLFKVAVYGPSDDIFIWWGHAALILEYTNRNFSLIFEWGIFSHPSDSFLKDFLREEVRYKTDTGFPDMDKYIKEDRDITVYTLNLDKTARKIIMAYVADNILSTNDFYDYHEFRDNCSTRIRDIIDRGTRGQFKAAFDAAPGRFSIRQHLRRYTWNRPFSDWFLGFLMGQDLDESITPWDEMFLPVEVARNITDFTYMDDTGVRRKLLSSAEIINTSKNRQPFLNEPLTTWPFALAIGLIVATLLFFVKIIGKKFPRTGRILLGALQSILGLFLGIAGCVLVFGFLMNNDYIQQNINILFVNPLLLVMAPLGILYAANIRFPFTKKALSILWTYVFIAGAITVLLRILPFFFQQNQSVQGLILPIAFVFSCFPEWMGHYFCPRLLYGNHKVNPSSIPPVKGQYSLLLGKPVTVLPVNSPISTVPKGNLSSPFKSSEVYGLKRNEKPVWIPTPNKNEKLSLS